MHEVGFEGAEFGKKFFINEVKNPPLQLRPIGSEEASSRHD